MNVFISEQMRIAMQCSKAAQQCHMLMMFPWMCWLAHEKKKESSAAS